MGEIYKIINSEAATVILSDFPALKEELTTGKIIGVVCNSEHRYHQKTKKINLLTIVRYTDLQSCSSLKLFAFLTFNFAFNLFRL